MSGNHSLPKQNALRGIFLLSLAMLLIPVVDTIAKYLSAELSPLYLSWARYFAASLFIVPIAMRKFGRNIFPRRNIKSHFTRTFFIISAMLCFFISISTTPLATTVAVTMIAPIVATVFAVIVLKEKLTWVKTIALILGLSGALIIINPRVEMENGVIFAALAGLFYGLYMVTTRMTAQASDPIKTLCFQCVVGMVFLIPFAVLNWSMPTTDQLLLLLFMGIVSITAHGMTILAFQYAQASVLSPFIYLEIVSAAILGYFVFADVPGIAFWIGTTIIVIAGLLISFTREKST
jgi:drug/metabolite transporter (DMT)-like permease